MGVATPAIFASFRHEWYENGTYSVRYVRPVYAGDEIRVVWEEVEPDFGDSRKISFWLEKRDGEQTTFGWAALGEAGTKLMPPWERGSASAKIWPHLSQNLPPCGLACPHWGQTTSSWSD